VTQPIDTYNGLDEGELNKAKAVLESLLAGASSPEPAEEVQSSPFAEIPPAPELLGLSPGVYKQVQGALNSGKQHLMFYGPPGTGKTTLAQHVARVLHADYRLITGSADWTSQDIIGGYQPAPAGQIRFVAGILLEHFDKPLIIDELNRCDIDKVLGPLFTGLSGQSTTLPYQTKPGEPASPRYSILPRPKLNAEPHEFAPGPAWRLLATINSIDRASLYQMSYALMRRFAWILVDVPPDREAFLREYVKAHDLGPADDDAVGPLSEIWHAVMEVRPLGPAPFIDIINYCRAVDASFDFFAPASNTSQDTYLEGLACFLMPMLDGILIDQASKLADVISKALNLDPSSESAAILDQQLKALAI
jgi:5-methylcytosine-specific restriction protein B